MQYLCHLHTVELLFSTKRPSWRALWQHLQQQSITLSCSPKCQLLLWRTISHQFQHMFIPWPIYHLGQGKIPPLTHHWINLIALLQFFYLVCVTPSLSWAACVNLRSTTVCQAIKLDVEKTQIILSIRSLVGRLNIEVAGFHPLDIDPCSIWKDLGIVIYSRREFVIF